MNLPNPNEIKKLYTFYHIPKHIVKHLQTVKETVLYLATELNKRGENYNLDLLSVAAELHDIAKPLTFKRLERGKAEKFGWDPVPEENFDFWEKERKKFPVDYLHPEIGAMILKDYPELAEVVGNHSPKQILKDGLSKEAILLNYVDKRSMDKVVTLEERFSYLADRYGKPKDQDGAKVFARYKEIEKEIFNKLGFPAEELAERMKNN
jgi:hypothetical protein